VGLRYLTNTYTCGSGPRCCTSGSAAATQLLRVRSDGIVEVDGALQAGGYTLRATGATGESLVPPYTRGSVSLVLKLSITGATGESLVPPCARASVATSSGQQVKPWCLFVHAGAFISLTGPRAKAWCSLYTRKRLCLSLSLSIYRTLSLSL